MKYVLKSIVKLHNETIISIKVIVIYHENIYLK